MNGRLVSSNGSNSQRVRLIWRAVRLTLLRQAIAFIPSVNAIPTTMKKLLLILSLAASFAFAASAQAQSWGFSFGNGNGFFFSRGQAACAPVYVAPAPVYYQRPVVVYQQPQTVYMQPYQQMRPVVYPQTIVYRSEPVVIREYGRRCNSRW